MNADPMAVQNLFAQAVAIADPNQRQAFIREQCADDAELLRRVEALLAAYDAPKPFFDQPTAQLADLPASAAYQSTDVAQRPGSVVAGRYKLLEAIGEGGMGTVWVAEQTSPVRRKVALKLVKPGMDSRQVLARFDAERQALALMDHPNIAKVFDGGVTEQGRPFFAMEYVKGMPLTEYCDQVRLSLEERLKLFIPICHAVQHAHQKGIIHRDLKPSNVLICLYDGKPVPKVIDFGLAKAMYQPLTEHTLHTGHGLMIGTPLYMSPEQAEHNNLDVDTRTDIYSLGVMLYELLTGTTPLERAQFKEAAFGEILRLIKEVEPPKPSTRVSTNAQRASIAAQRSLEPEQLGRSIRGDLDWIVMKALDKERDRRYETANGLARDLERFLNQEAVEACPPSTVYRLRKQFHKHRAALSTAAAFLLLLCVGAVVSTWQAYRAIKAEQLAIAAEATARQERDKARENERQALEAKRAESEARVAEERARLAESQQRAEAESQRIEAVKQRDEAQRPQQEAVARSTQLQQLTEEQRRAIYASDMNLVRIEAQRGNKQRMREILYQQLPIDHSDLRGFEWYYWYRYLNQAAGNDVLSWANAMSGGDRFALNSRPMPVRLRLKPSAPSAIPNLPKTSAYDLIGWQFSSSLDHFAYRSSVDRLLIVRTAAGQVAFSRDGGEAPLDQSELRTFFAPGIQKFNPTGTLLALANGFSVSLIDLQTAEVRWTTPLGTNRLDSLALEFSSDESELIVVSDLDVLGFQLESGRQREIFQSTPEQPFQVSELRHGSDGLFFVGLANNGTRNGLTNSIDVRSASDGRLLYSIPFDASSSRGFAPPVPIRLSPNTKQMVRAFNEQVEMWDLPSGRLLLKTIGSDARYSQDGQRLVITQAASSTLRPASTGATVTWDPPVESVQIVSVSNGQMIAELSLAGDEADEIRISPDGNRLLTLHGSQPNHAVIRAARARLWDCESGREILDFPIADDCKYYWDLEFDPSGNLLIGGIFSPATDGESAGHSLYLDASPLSPADDAQLIATHWTNRLKEQTPVPQQMLESIQQNTICAPLVREAALDMAAKIKLEPATVVDRCLEIIERPNRDSIQYQQALSWVQALETEEAGSLRTIALASAAYYRLGKVDEALETLRKKEPTQLDADHADFRWEQLRRSIEILCLRQRDDSSMETHRRCIQLADYVHDAFAKNPQSPTPEAIQWPILTQEALRTQGGRFFASQIQARVRTNLDRDPLPQAQNPTSVEQRNGLSSMFEKLDQNQDGILTASEVASLMPREWLQFDKDGVEGLSRAEFAVATTISRARGAAQRKVYNLDRQKLQHDFERIDKDKDSRLTSTEVKAEAWRSFKVWDTDEDGGLDFDEFQKMRYQGEYVKWLMDHFTQSSPVGQVKLMVINAALEDHPGEANLLNTRAFLLATSPDETLLNGEQAVQDATRSCEEINYQVPFRIDTLAAAYAQVGDFDKAIEFAEKAIGMVGPGKTLREYQARLELYRQKKPYRQPASDRTGVSDFNNSSEQPLFSTDQIAKALRIPGGEPCWSADGKRLIYALTGFGAEHSFFESLDLQTGEREILCRGGQRPVCSPVDETLAFIRPVVEAPTEIWLYDLAKNTEKKMADGFQVHWLSDGTLCYSPYRAYELICVHPERIDSPLWSFPGATSPFVSALSPDGKRYGRMSFGKWSIFEREHTQQIPTVAYVTTDAGRADWSPDGRVIAYGTRVDNRHGVWLIDTHTQETRLLADLAAYPRWSPDGKTLALGLQSSNEILLLDVSSLDALWKENPAETPKQP